MRLSEFREGYMILTRCLRGDGRQDRDAGCLGKFQAPEPFGASLQMTRESTTRVVTMSIIDRCSRVIASPYATFLYSQASSETALTAPKPENYSIAIAQKPIITDSKAWSVVKGNL